MPQVVKGWSPFGPTAENDVRARHICDQRLKQGSSMLFVLIEIFLTCKDFFLVVYDTQHDAAEILSRK